jgi:hypothetical protein
VPNTNTNNNNNIVHFLLAVKIIVFLQLGIILNNEGSVVEDFFFRIFSNLKNN